MKTWFMILAVAGVTLPLMGQQLPTQEATMVAAASGLSLVRAESAVASNITVTGRIIAVKSATISPRVSGQLAEFGKSPSGQPLDVGMKVKAGDILFVLDQTTFRSHLGLAEARYASANATLANLTAPVREERLEQLRQDLAQIEARLADRTKESVRFRHLVEVERTLPARRLEEVVLEVQTLTAQKLSAQARLREALEGPTASEIAVARARVAEAEASLQIAKNDLRDSTVTAPYDGVITRRFVSVGDFIASAPPTNVLTLVNSELLEAEIAIPESYLQFINAGETQLVLRSPLLQRPLSLPVSRVVENINVTGNFFCEGGHSAG